MVIDNNFPFPLQSDDLFTYAVERDPYMGKNRLGRVAVADLSVPDDPYRQLPDGVPNYCFTRPDVRLGDNQVVYGNEHRI